MIVFGWTIRIRKKNLKNTLWQHRIVLNGIFKIVYLIYFKMISIFNLYVSIKLKYNWNYEYYKYIIGCIPRRKSYKENDSLAQFYGFYVCTL